MKTRISRHLKNIEGLYHHLPFMCDGHKCRTPHGHSFWVEVIVEGDVDGRGLCAGIDTAEIETIWRAVHTRLDHAGSMNEIPGLENPTTEVFTRWIWDHFNKVWRDNERIHNFCVHVKEGYWSHCWVEGSPGPARE